MNRRQAILVILAALLHGILAALCLWGDTPAPGNYHDVLPLLTMFLMAPLLSTGVSLVIAGFTGFWRRGGRLWMPLTSLGAMAICFTLVYSSLGEALLWVFFFPWFLFQYGCSMVTLCGVRWLFRRLATRPGGSSGTGKPDDPVEL